MSRTAWLYHPDFLAHRTGPGHPENPRRLSVIVERVNASGLLNELTAMEPAIASRDTLLLAHDSAYVAWLEEAGASGRMFRADADTIGSPGTWPAALRAAGAVVTAVDAVLRGDVVRAFCAVRPPGHHAERDRAMGFCFLNNVAIGARHAQRRGLRRVAVLDWDVHHGNGTQHIFEEEASVLYVSLHQYPLYPGTGRACERGRGAGQNATLNVPMAPGSTDTDYLRTMEKEVLPTMERFAPEMIFISAGFDAHADDPLAAMRVTAEGFARMTEMTCALAVRVCGGRIVSVLEGGYHLPALAACVEAHIRALLS